MACSACNTEVPAGARFCTVCGAPTGATLPAAERRAVTVMFCDLAESTALSARLDAEDYREVILAYHAAVAAEIARHGGFVAKYMGDGVLAYLGYPQAREDDPEQAVRAGLAIVEAVAGLKVQAARLEVRVGVATGPVVVGDPIGTGAARELAITGVAPNLAARLQQLAVGGGVVICEETHRLTGRLFGYAELGAQALKGFEAPQAAWRVTGAEDGVDRFAALRWTMTPLVGRADELSRLAELWARVRQGEGRAALISGEPGVGKSRLLAAFLETVGDAVVLRRACAPGGTESAFLPSAQALARRCGFAPGDTDDQRLDRLDALLAAAFGEPEPRIAVLMALLLALPRGRYPPLGLAPTAIRSETVAALLALTRRLAGPGPAILVFEDVHWADPSSQELMRVEVEALVAGQPVLALYASRPPEGPSAAWLRGLRLEHLRLERLDPAAAEAMIQAVAGQERLDATARRLVLDHAEGVPLFIEEISRAVLEGGSRDVARVALAGRPLARDAMPPSLNASLLTRFDRLGAAKGSVQAAATIGREFPRALLAHVSSRTPAELAEDLGQLVAADIIQPAVAGSPAEPTYVFRHALIRDIAYSTLLRGPRRQLHLKIAEAMRRRFPGQTEARPEVVAYHLAEGGRPREAIVAWRAAAVRSARRGAVDEALILLSYALDALEALPQGAARDAVEADLQMIVGGVAVAARGFIAPQTVQAYERAFELAQALGDARLSALAGGRRFLPAFMRDDFDTAFEISHRLHAELGEGGDPTARAILSDAMASSALFIGRYREARASAREAADAFALIKAGGATADYFLETPFITASVGALTLANLACADLPGFFAGMDALAAEADAHGPNGAVLACTLLVLGRYLVGDQPALAPEVERLVATIHATGGYHISSTFSDLVGALCRVIGGEAVSADQIDQMLQVRVALGLHLALHQMIAADVETLSGRDARAEDFLRAALEGGPFGCEQWLRGEVLRRLGAVVARRDPAAGAQVLADAVAAAADQGAAFYELRALQAQVRLQRRRGMADPARAAEDRLSDRLRAAVPPADAAQAAARLEEPWLA